MLFGGKIHLVSTHRKWYMRHSVFLQSLEICGEGSPPTLSCVQTSWSCAPVALSLPLHVELLRPVKSPSWGRLLSHVHVCAQWLQLCLLLCDPMDRSLLGCSLHVSGLNAEVG